MTRPSTSLSDAKESKTWITGTIPVMTTEGLGRAGCVRPLPREREAAHHADTHFAGHGVARHLAGEVERQRHRIGDGDFPGDVVAGDRAVENLRRIALGALRA